MGYSPCDCRVGHTSDLALSREAVLCSKRHSARERAEPALFIKKVHLGSKFSSADWQGHSLTPNNPQWT